MRKGELTKRMDYIKLKALMQNFLARRIVRQLLEPDGDGRFKADVVLQAYANRQKPPRLGVIGDNTVYRFLDMAAHALGMSDDQFRNSLKHPNIRRTIINALHTLDKYGINFPLRFWAPLMVVWNLTWACNLKCKHCYENAGPLRSKELKTSELSLDEKLRVVDQIADSYIPTLSFSGGEPLIHKHFWPVAERAAEKGLYLSMNTNGTLITEEVAKRLEELNFAYVAISVDSPDPATHDEFRGVPGSWEKTVQGIRNMKRTKVSTVLSYTVTKYNCDHLPQIFELAKQLEVDKVMVYNFVPTGRGEQIIHMDISPQMREAVLEKMYEFAVSGGSLCSTAPQLGRMCLEKGRPDLVPLAHTGPGRAGDYAILSDLIGGCGVGRAYCAVQPDGRITPCVYMPEVTIGHVNESTILDVWHRSPIIKELGDRTGLEGHCGVCEYRQACGGCRARAYAYFGNFKGPDPGCINNLTYYEELLRGKRITTAGD